MVTVTIYVRMVTLDVSIQYMVTATYENITISFERSWTLTDCGLIFYGGFFKVTYHTSYGNVRKS